MAKIRGFKPDLWTDDDFVEVSAFARLLWLGMWNFACDNGHIQDKSKQIKMRILPTDDVNCAELIRELADQGLINRADGWILIPNLTHHQKPDRRYFTTCSKEGCEAPEQTDSQRKSRRVHAVHTPGTPRVHAVTTPSARGDGDGDGDGDGELKVMVNKPSANAEPEGFQSFWDAYDKKQGRKNAIAKYRLALKKSGVSPELLLNAAIDYTDWLKVEGKHPQYAMDPSRWLLGEHWNDERAARAATPQMSTTDKRVSENSALTRRLMAEEAEAESSNVRAIGTR